MECAIVQRNGNDVDVFNDSSVVPNNPYGLGHELHADFATRDCLGVADSVVLNQPSGSDPTFGVIYPVQTDFSDLVLPADGTRKFDLYLVTGSINSSGLLSSSTPVVIQSGVVFDGPTLPSGGTAKGLILPDAAPSSAENAFWLTYEAQRVNPPNIIGGVRLEYYIFDPTNNAWNMDAAKNFVTSNPSSIYLNRRPHISSMPGVSTNEEVSLVFNFVPSPPVGSNANVFCEQWEYSGGGLQQLMSQAFPNDTSENDGKPTVLHGPATPLIRRCYFGREEGGPSGGGIWYYDVNTSSLVQESISNTADRPASDYGLVQGEHTLPLTWEDELFPIGAPVHKRIVLKPKWLQ